MTGQDVLDFERQRLAQQREAEERVRHFTRLGGFAWLHGMAGFTTKAGAAEFARLYPDVRVFVLAEEKRQ
jgi:hypothetical protein